VEKKHRHFGKRHPAEPTLPPLLPLDRALMEAASRALQESATTWRKWRDYQEYAETLSAINGRIKVRLEVSQAAQEQQDEE
jgi:hypothetical protein